MTCRRLSLLGRRIERLCPACDIFFDEEQCFYPLRTAKGTKVIEIQGVILNGVYGTMCKPCQNRKSAENTRKRHAQPGARAGMLLNAAKQRVAKNKLKLTITKEWIQKRLELGVCEVTGVPLDLTPSMKNRQGHGLWNAPSLDRKDNNLGYTPENTQVTCAMFNFCKKEWSQGQVEMFVKEYHYHLVEQRKAERAAAKAERERQRFDGQTEMW